MGGRRLLSVAVLAGFVVALVLEQTGRSGLARYIDPAMVALVSAAFLPVPAELVVSGFRELLMTSPGPQLQARIAP